MKKIAIVGSGISGLSSAYMLQSKYEVTLYEKNHELGGHTRTVMVGDEGRKVPVDTGFIVFNQATYPNLTAFFNHLEVSVNKGRMSFGVSINNGQLEYGSNNLNNVFAQRKNIVKPKFIKLVADIVKFNKYAKANLHRYDNQPDINLRDCLEEMKLSSWFINYYLLAMGAAIWSTPIKKMYDFPASSFLRFFNNHGLLSITDQPQWYTVDGGSHQYIEKIKKNINADIRLNCAVSAISRLGGKVQITDNSGNQEEYDHVILASHANQTLSMLSDVTNDERKLLSAIKYQKNRMVLHSDTSIMPKNKRAWSSWVYLAENMNSQEDNISLSYWMNNLQELGTKKPMVVTLNPSREPALSLKHDEYIFEHPVFDQDAIKAQKNISSIQGKQNTWFAGAYLSYGFHEDGLKSAINVANSLGVMPSWLPQ